MSSPQSSGENMDAKIWMVLIGILVLFAGLMFYARHVNNVRQGQAVPVVARYTNYAYGVNLRYPPEWLPASGQSFDRYEGASGFFGISAGGTGGITLDQMTRNEANHKLKPYGADPYIQSLVIDGQDARLIMPSLDQDPSMNGQAVLIVEYPEPRSIGSETYKFLVFWADRSNIQDIASSITFVR